MALPNWPGAAHCYRRSYAMLEHMAQHGHVTRPLRDGRRIIWGCGVSDEMRDIIDALNHGDEELIKYHLMIGGMYGHI